MMTEREMESLMDQYTERLLRTAFGLGIDESSAEELVQDTFVAFFQGQDRFEGRSKLSTYLFGILYNKVREFRREKDRERKIESIDDLFENQFIEVGHFKNEVEKSLTEPERAVNNGELSQLLSGCLEKLTTPLRMAFTLKEVEGCVTSQICEILSVDANHLGVLLFRARTQLRACLESGGAFHI